MLETSRIYLASRSPRRRELLTQMGVHFDTVLFRSSARGDDIVDESVLDGESAVDYVQRVARAKATHGSQMAEVRHLRRQPALSADTTIEFEDRIIGKPQDEQDAWEILRCLSGNTHRVLTCVAMADGAHMESVLSVSEVRFRVLDDAEIRRYVASGEPMDKAGAYGIQGRAGMFVEHLSGSYTGVMGLPLCETALLLRRFNVVF